MRGENFSEGASPSLVAGLLRSDSKFCFIENTCVAASPACVRMRVFRRKARTAIKTLVRFIASVSILRLSFFQGYHQAINFGKNRPATFAWTHGKSTSLLANKWIAFVTTERWPIVTCSSPLTIASGTDTRIKSLVDGVFLACRPTILCLSYFSNLFHEKISSKR